MILRSSPTITETDMSTLAISSMATIDVMKLEPEPPYFGSTSIPINYKYGMSKWFRYSPELSWKAFCQHKWQATYTISEDGFDQWIWHHRFFIHNSRKWSNLILCKLPDWNRDEEIVPLGYWIGRVNVFSANDFIFTFVYFKEYLSRLMFSTNIFGHISHERFSIKHF